MKSYIIKGFLIIFLIISIYLLNDTSKNILEKKLLSEWKNNTHIKITDLIKKNFKLACIVYPYSSEIINNLNFKQIEKINNYLKKNKFNLPEDKWALTILNNNNEIEIFIFKRKKIDIVSTKVDIVKVIEFNNNECVNSKNGFFYLYSKKKKKHMIIGELK